MCDNSRECRAAAAAGFRDSGRRRPLDDVPDTTPVGPAVPIDVHPKRIVTAKPHVMMRVIAEPLAERGLSPRM